jgi:O-antigen/teichoic acid export membrane protein
MENNPSLKKRYFYKLVTNFVGFGISLITTSVVPRALGPKNFGDYGYLTTYFTQFIGFFDIGSSGYLSVRLSKKPEESAVILFYFYFIELVAIITFLFILFSRVISVDSSIWQDQFPLFVIFAAAFCLIDWVFRILNNITDAYALTISAEKMKVVQKLIGLFLILVFFYSNSLSMLNYFFYQYIIYAFIIASLVYIIRKSGIADFKSLILKRIQIKSYLKEFYGYTAPLFVMSAIAVITTIFDGWFLQEYGGSIQQGYFRLSSSISAICILFTSAMTPLLMREFSIFYEKKDIQAMASLFRKYSPILYSIAAYFSCFIAIEAEKVVAVFGGVNFKEAALPLTIMAFYPVHQTYGQITGSVFFATGQTKLYRNIGVIFSFVGVIFTYFFIAPANMFGLNSGATGLVIKMIIVNILSVNVFLYYSTKLLKITFWKYLGHQFLSVASFAIIALFSRWLVNVFDINKLGVIPSFLISGFIYSIFVVSLLYFIPLVFGLNRQNIEQIKSEVLLRYKKYLNKS